VHAISINGPAFDLLHTMSKFLVMGVRCRRVVQGAPPRRPPPSAAKDLGTFQPGAIGDATLLQIEEGEFTYLDVRACRSTQQAAGIARASCWAEMWHPG